eukprot:488037_1
MNDVQQQQQLLIGKLQQKLTDSQTEIQQLRHELRNNTSKVDINRHSTEFWILVKVNCLNDPDNVKALVQTKKITVNDTTENNETLLNVAASVGSYDIVQFCINIGFDINHKDKWDNTPLDNAKYGHHLVTYRYPAPSQFASETTFWYGWSQRTMIGYVAYNTTLESLTKLMSIVGEKVFCEGVFLKADRRQNALQEAIEQEKWSMLKYMMNVASIRGQCMEDMNELHSVISFLNQYFDASMGSFLIDALKLNQETLNELKKEKGTDITKLAALVQ